MMGLFFSALVLGFIFNAAPGAVFAETIRQGVRGGFRPALLVQVGSLVGDAVWAVLGLAGVGLLLQADTLRVPVGIAGVLYLSWLSFEAWRASTRAFDVQMDAGATRTADVGLRAVRRSALRAGAMISLTNPQNVAYWAALGSAMGAVGLHAPTKADYAVFFAGFMVSSILWSFVCAALVALLFRNATPGWVRFTYRACALAFLLLALSSLRDLWSQVSVQGLASEPRAGPGASNVRASVDRRTLDDVG